MQTSAQNSSTRTNLSTLIGLAVLTSLAGACTGELMVGNGEAAPVSITAPIDGAIVKGPMLTIEGTSPGQYIDVNGQNTPSLEGVFATNMPTTPGQMVITATFRGETDTVTVTVDSDAPVLTITEPADYHAAHIEGDTFTVAGRVDDITAVTLKIGEATVPVAADGTFSHSVTVGPGGQRVRVEASDVAGNKSADFVAALVGEFMAPGAPVIDGAGLWLGAETFREISNGAGSMIAGMDFNSFLPNFNPVYDDTWGKTEVTNIAIGSVDISLVPTHGALDATVAVHGLRIDIKHKKSFIRVRGDIFIGTTTVSGKVGLSLGESGLQATFTDSNLELDDFNFDINNFPGAIENLIEDRIGEKVEEMLGGALETAVPGMLENALAGVALEQDLDLLGTTINLSGNLASLELSPSGLSAGLTARAQSAAANAASHGALIVAEAPPILGESQLGVRLSLDLVNALLKAATADPNFAVRMPLDSASVATITALDASVGTLAPLDAPVAASLSFPLEPVAVDVDGVLSFFAPAVEVELLAEVEGADVSLGTLSVSITAPLNVSTEGGELSLGLGEVELFADIVEGFPTPNLDAVSMDIIIGGMVQGAIEGDGTGAGGLLGLDGLALPNLAGFMLMLDRVEPVGGHLVIEGALSFGGGMP